MISKKKIIEAEKKKGRALVGSTTLKSMFNDNINRSNLTDSEIKKILDY